MVFFLVWFGSVALIKTILSNFVFLFFICRNHQLVLQTSLQEKLDEASSNAARASPSEEEDLVVLREQVAAQVEQIEELTRALKEARREKDESAAALEVSTFLSACVERSIC